MLKLLRDLVEVDASSEQNGSCTMFELLLCETQALLYKTVIVRLLSVAYHCLFFLFYLSQLYVSQNLGQTWTLLQRGVTKDR